MVSLKRIKEFFCIGSKKRSNIKKIPIKVLEIGSPTDFKHINHIGLSNDTSSVEVSYEKAT